MKQLKLAKIVDFAYYYCYTNDSEVARRTGLSCGQIAPTRKNTDRALKYFTPRQYESVSSFHEEMVLDLSKRTHLSQYQQEFLYWSLNEFAAESVRLAQLAATVAKNRSKS